MRWIVGLGNPGRRYEGTRHNAGFAVVDLFASRHGYGGSREEFSALVATASPEVAAGEEVGLVKPQTYMNRSGQAVREILDHFGGAPADLLVVHDDIDLALGRLRYRARGSSGGHRGVESIIGALGTEEFARLKVGVGRPEGAGREGPDAADFVLSAAGPDERVVLDRAFERAAESLDVWIREGVDRAATLYNGPEQEPGQGRTAKGD